MDEDLIVWCVYWVCAIINILILWKMKKEEFYKDGVTLFDTIVMSIATFVPVINLVASMLLLFAFVGLFASEIVIIKPKQTKEDDGIKQVPTEILPKESIVKVGQKYTLNCSKGSPFGTEFPQYPSIILEVKEGWVRYRNVGSYYLDNRMEEEVFLRIHTLVADKSPMS